MAFSIAHPVTTPAFTSLTDTLSGTGTWTEITVVQGTNRISIWYAKAGASPGSGTITGNYDSNSTRTAWIVAEVTGQDTTTPIAESQTGGGTASTLSLTLTDIASGNLAYGGVTSSGASGITPGTNETELAEASSGGGSENRIQTEYGTDNVVDWSGLNTTANAGVGVEIAASATAVARRRVGVGAGWSARR